MLGLFKSRIQNACCKRLSVQLKQCLGFRSKWHGVSVSYYGWRPQFDQSCELTNLGPLPEKSPLRGIRRSRRTPVWPYIYGHPLSTEVVFQVRYCDSFNGNELAWNQVLNPQHDNGGNYGGNSGK